MDDLCCVPGCDNEAAVYYPSRCFMHLHYEKPRKPSKERPRGLAAPGKKMAQLSQKTYCRHPACQNKAQLRGLCIKHHADKLTLAAFGLPKRPSGRLAVKLKREVTDKREDE